MTLIRAAGFTDVTRDAPVSGSGVLRARKAEHLKDHADGQLIEVDDDQGIVRIIVNP